MAEKLCVFCKHINMDTMGCHGDYPDPATFECTKRHFQNVDKGSWGDGLGEEFRQVILMAETCPDYEVAA